MRIWTLEEQSFAGSVADLASLALEARNRKIAQEQLAEAKEIAESLGVGNVFVSISHTDDLATGLVIITK